MPKITSIHHLALIYIPNTYTDFISSNSLYIVYIGQEVQRAFFHDNIMLKIARRSLAPIFSIRILKLLVDFILLISINTRHIVVKLSERTILIILYYWWRKWVNMHEIGLDHVSNTLNIVSLVQLISPISQ